MTKRLKVCFISITGTLAAYASAPVIEFSDTTLLQELTVTASTPQRAVSSVEGGDFSLSTADTRHVTSTLGGGDPISLLRTLPAVQTPNDLQAGVSVRGMGYGDNMFTIDGVRVFNPTHLLGLFSAFNPAFVKNIRFSPGHSPATSVGAPGGVLSAESETNPSSPFSLDVAAGLIESHAGVSGPIIPQKLSFKIGVRQSYLNQVFPDILTVGHSKINYDFTDAAFALTGQPSAAHSVRLSAFFSRDKMTLRNRDMGSKDGDFGWRNAGASIRWDHTKFNVALSSTTFSNTFRMEEGGRSLSIPSQITQADLTAGYRLHTFAFSAFAAYRYASGQRNVKATAPTTDRSRQSLLEEVAAMWSPTISSALSAEIGLRFSAYQTSGLQVVMPQPRARISLTLPHAANLWLSAGRYLMFDRLVRETSGGLPADFFALACARSRPEDAWSANLGAGGTWQLLNITWSVETYAKLLRNATEFSGSILDLLNSNFNPEDHIVAGRGYSAGVSLMVAREIGKLKGRVCYTAGVSRLKLPIYGHGYIPSAFDRPHDLSATISYTPIRSLTFAATFTHATGLPYTKAQYGYMIEENLICQYYPHNSSRLPSYNRLDLSATWRFWVTRRASHSINLSVYNAAACRNTLFIYPSYSANTGVTQNKSVMSAVIPSLTYILSIK